MLRIMLCGCNGKMGQVITRLISERNDSEIVVGVDPFGGMKNTYPVYEAAADVTEKVDVIIDFSNPASLAGLITYAKKTGTPLVISTTGHTEEQKSQIFEASKSLPVFFSGNMSLGINLMMELIHKAAETLEGLFDIEIIEKHHNQKIDAPSGTALMLADTVNDALNKKCEYVYDRQSKRAKRTDREIGMHSIRGGTITGEHTVIFAGNDEVIEITHKAASKEIFAVGSIKAAQYMKDKPTGLYSMKNVFDHNNN